MPVVAPTGPVSASVILQWRDQVLVSDARGSNGHQYLVYAGIPMVAIMQIPAVERHGPSLIRKEEVVEDLAEGKALAQTWEDEEAKKWDTGIWE